MFAFRCVSEVGTTRGDGFVFACFYVCVFLISLLYRVLIKCSSFPFCLPLLPPLYPSPAKFVCKTAPVDEDRLEAATPSMCRVILFSIWQLFASFFFIVRVESPHHRLLLGLPDIVAAVGVARYFIFPLPFAIWMMLANCFVILTFKWILVGRYTDEVTWIYSYRYLNKWTYDLLMSYPLAIIRPTYASVYLPHWYGIHRDGKGSKGYGVRSSRGEGGEGCWFWTCVLKGCKVLWDALFFG